MVHGGSYAVGSSARYANVEEIGQKFVAKDIVVVAIQYRLGVLGKWYLIVCKTNLHFLGFASTGDNEMPGNLGKYINNNWLISFLGYWDQVEALKFVHRNAKAFGGSPDKITLYGSSAGAASVGALSISPHSRDYVYQVIGTKF